MMPQIAIIILHYKNLADTKACLRSLRKLDYDNYSIIVVNNDSRDQAENLRPEFSGFIAIIQNDENLGFSEGNNVGIRAALADSRTDAILILNNDTEVEPDFLSEMVSKLSAPFRYNPLLSNLSPEASCPPKPRPSRRAGRRGMAKGEEGERGGSVGADMVAPRIMRRDKREQVDNLGLTLMGSGLAFNRRTENEKLFCPSGAAALYSRRLLEAIKSPPRRPVLRSPALREGRGEGGGWAGGGAYFDPAFFAYCEDLDLGWRARLAGFTTGYAPNAIVYHKGSASTKPMSDFAVYHTYRNLLWTHFKNLPLTLFLWQSPWLAAGWLFLFALYTLKGRPGIILSAFWDGLLGLRFMIKKRREIQRHRIVSDKQILSWFATGLFPKTYLKK